MWIDPCLECRNRFWIGWARKWAGSFPIAVETFFAPEDFVGVFVHALWLPGEHQGLGRPRNKRRCRRPASWKRKGIPVKLLFFTKMVIHLSLYGVRWKWDNLKYKKSELFGLRKETNFFQYQPKEKYNDRDKENEQIKEGKKNMFVYITKNHMSLYF